MKAPFTRTLVDSIKGVRADITVVYAVAGPNNTATVIMARAGQVGVGTTRNGHTDHAMTLTPREAMEMSEALVAAAKIAEGVPN